MQRRLLISILSILIASCSSVSKTNELEPGMTLKEVAKVMGDPSQTQLIGDKRILKYSLHQKWKGWVPYYLVFGKGSDKLEEWIASEEEYMQKQKLWLEAFPPSQKHDVDIKME